MGAPKLEVSEGMAKLKTRGDVSKVVLVKGLQETMAPDFKVGRAELGWWSVADIGAQSLAAMVCWSCVIARGGAAGVGTGVQRGDGPAPNANTNTEYYIHI